MKFFAMVVGAGLSGATVARCIAEEMNRPVLVVEQRRHVAGNAYDYVDYGSGMLVHKYGPHFFHTQSQTIWNFVNQFAKFTKYNHKVEALVHDQKYRLTSVPLPINYESIERIYAGKPRLGADIIEKMRELGAATNWRPVPILDMLNKDEPILRELAQYLFSEVYEPYTKIMWGDRIPVAQWRNMVGRIPVRHGHEDRLFVDYYQGMPEDGYTQMVNKMLDHEKITVLTEVDANDVIEVVDFWHLIHTGSIDKFLDFELGVLPYRNVEFEQINSQDVEYQHVATLNYPNLNGRMLRSTDYSHLPGPNKGNAKTSVMREYASEARPRTLTGPDLQMYPIPTPPARNLYDRYKQLLQERIEEGRYPYTVYFLGRQGAYQYIEMGQAVGAALKFARDFIAEYRDD